MQPAELLVEIGKAGRDPRKRPVALIGGKRGLHRLGRGLEERHEPLLDGPLLGQGVEPLLGLGDLVPGIALDLDGAGAVGDVAAKPHEFAPHREVVDHLRVVARGEGRDGGAREPGEIGRPAQFLQRLILFQIGLEGDRRGQRVLLDARDRHLEYALVDRFEEMLALHQAGDAVVDVVVGQDRAEQLLFGLDVVRKRILSGRVLDRADRRYVVHDCPPFLA